MKTNHHKHTAFRVALLAACALTLGMLPMGNAWASWTISEDGNTITFDEGVKTVGSSVSKDSYEGEKPLNTFENIIINANNTHGMDLQTNRVDFSNSNITVNVNGTKSNMDGVRLYNNIPNFQVYDYTAYIHTPISDAINIDRGSTANTSDGAPYVHIKGNLHAEVDQGHGIRANASTKTVNGQGVANTITVNGDSLIKIYGDSSSQLKSPTAVWAGDDYLFGVKGKGEVYLKGNTTLQLDGDGNYGVWAGRNGEITANNVNVTAMGKDSYGIAATDGNIDISFDLSKNQYGSTVTLNGDVIINEDVLLGEREAPENFHAFYASSQYGVLQSGDKYAGGSNKTFGSLQVEETAYKEIGLLAVAGDIEAEDGGHIDLTVTAEQNYLLGDIKAQGKEGNETAKVSLKVENALTGQGTIAAANGGTVLRQIPSGEIRTQIRLTMLLVMIKKFLPAVR